MWNQWSAGPPPMPPPSCNPQPPLIGPVQPSAIAPPSTEEATTGAGVPVQQVAAYSLPSGAPSYTPAQYAAMTPEQQYAVQQHWQQWQAYEQQYAQWHAQYGEQYKREMAAIHGGPPPAIPQYSATSSQNISSSFAYPPPAVTNVYQAPPAPAQAPPPPPPADNNVSAVMNAPLQIYEQPPPPPPPPQPEKNIVNENATSQLIQPSSISVENTSGSQQRQDNQWCKPPPHTQGNRKGESCSTGFQNDRQQNQYDQYTNNNKRGNQNHSNSPLDQQNTNQGRDYRLANRPANDYQGRGFERGGNNYDNHRKQPNEDFEGRNMRQHQSWQQSDSISQRNSRGSVGGRYDNYDSYNKNMGPNMGGRQGWNNSSRGNTYSSLDNQKQQQTFQQNSSNINNSVNNANSANTSSGSLDESAFDEQFRLWEEQFENWKKENANHPDRVMYMQYEREFEKTRIRLLERREQMRRRKLMELQQSQPEQPLQEQIQPHGVIAYQEPESQRSDQNVNERMSEPIPEQASDINIKKIEDADLLSTRKCTELHLESQDCTTAENEQINDKTGFKKNEISELFKPADGIPGLDLVASNDEHNDDDPSEHALEPEVIDLDNDGPSRPPKVPATLLNVEALIPLSTKQKSAEKTELPNLVGHTHVALSDCKIKQKKIPSLFDIMVENPLLSPSIEQPKKISERDHSPTENRSSKIDVRSATIDSHSRSISRDREALASPGQRPSSQLSSDQRSQNIPEVCNSQLESQPSFLHTLQQSNLPPPVADLAKVLQDPNVMQLLTAALTQAQSGALSQSGNPEQAQLIQQLQKLQPLIQMQQQGQGQNPNIQPWNNLQSQQWQSQNQNSNIRESITSNQNRNSWGGNPFNRSNDSFSLNLGNESLSFNRDEESLPLNRVNESFPLSRGPVSGLGSGLVSGRRVQFGSGLGSRFGSGPGSGLGSGLGTGDEFDDNNDLQHRNPHNPFRRNFGNVENKNFSDEFRNAGGSVSFNESKSQRMSGSFGGLENAQQSSIANFGGNTRFDNSRKGAKNNKLHQRRQKVRM